MKLGFSMAFKYKTPKPKHTSFLIVFPFWVFWVPVILHGKEKKKKGEKFNHGQGSWSLHWYWQKSQRSILFIIFSKRIFLGLAFFSSIIINLFRVIFYFFDICCGNFFLFVCVNCRSFVQGLSERPQVHYHYLLSNWSCKFFLLLLLL